MAENVVESRSSILAKIIRYWLPVFGMIAVMYYFSTDVFSTENTQGVIQRLLGWLMPDTRQQTVHKVNFVIRKAMHFIEYGILVALAFRAFRADSLRTWRLRWAVYAFCMVAGWAVLDEYHQSFTATRGESIYDVMIDCAGGLCALVLIAFFARRTGRPVN